jgi:hypothetical protein
MKAKKVTIINYINDAFFFKLAQTDNKCVDSFDIPHMNSTKGLILKPGSPCIGTLGYCDIFSKCRSVDGEGPLSRLKNFILNPVTLSSIRDWITVIFLFFYLSFIKSF